MSAHVSLRLLLELANGVRVRIHATPPPPLPSSLFLLSVGMFGMTYALPYRHHAHAHRPRTYYLIPDGHVFFLFP